MGDNFESMMLPELEQAINAINAERDRLTAVVRAAVARKNQLLAAAATRKLVENMTPVEREALKDALAVSGE